MTVDLLVVGGTGLLGTEVVHVARAGGRRVVATFHHGEPDDGEWAPLDVRAPDEIRRLVADLRPRAIVNAAYVQRGADLDAITARAPAELAAAGAATGSRLVHVSSDMVFRGDFDRPYTETDAVDPVNDYGRAKAAAEAGVATVDPGAAILRTSLLWGGAGDGGPQVRLVRDPTVVFFTNEVRNPLRVDRLAVACLEVADRPDVGGVLHVAGADTVDRLTLARHLAPLAGIDPGALRGADDASGSRASRLALDTTLARSLLKSPLPGVAADAPAA